MSNAKVTPVAPHEDDLDTKYTTFGIDAATLDQLNVDQMAEQNKAKLIEFGGPRGVAKLLCADLDNGLADYEIKNNFARRREKFGTNNFPEPPSATFLELFLDCFKDTTIIILCIASIASLVTGTLEHPETGWIEGFAIIVAVMIVAVVTSTNNYTKEKQFRLLNAKNDEVVVKVIRDGRPDQASISDINVGDIVHLDAGDKIPADGIYIKGQDAKANESSLTGEPDDVVKNSTDDPFLLSGCVLASGYCDMLVIAIGKNSRWGKIRSKLALEHPPTPLMEKLEIMAKFIGYVGMGTSICTMIVMIIKYFVSDEKRQSVSIPSQLIEALLVGITIVVVAIPEGLPLAVTISLSYSTKKMLRDNNLIRVLAACETMGNVTSICSDKTGTLTENRMTVVEAFVFGKHYDQNDLKNKLFQFEKAILNDLAVNISCNSSAQIISKNNMIRVQGNKTEGALLLWINSLNYEHDILRSENMKESRGDRQFPFSSLKKTMAAIVKKPGGGFRLYSKGASEIVFGRCDRIRMSDGSIHAVDDTIKKDVQEVIIKMAQNALRTFCVAWRDFEENELPADLQTLQEAPDSSGLICDAIFGIMDPLRADVPDAVAMCRRAGIMVRMVTGDNIHTATAIAKQCGIFTADGIALEGPNFRMMKDEELDKVITRLQVLARSSPDDKFKLVNFLKSRREVVGVTGDGTNDAPALKTADVGLSMGISGTDLAKEASDIVIMDDRFSSIKQAVLWGRSVYDNIRKFLCFQLTVNVVALVLTFISAIFGFNPPLNAVMMLWVNLIMDTMGALALGTEEPTLRLLERRPYRRDASILSKMLWKNILIQAIFQVAVLLCLLFYLPGFLDIHQGNYCEKWKIKTNLTAIAEPSVCYTISEKKCDSDFTTCWIPQDPSNLPTNYPRQCVEYCLRYDYTHYSFIFNTFVFSQVFNEFNSRCVGNDPWIFHNITKSPIFLSIIALTVILQILMVQIGGNFLKTSALSLNNFILSIGIALLTLPLGLFMRFIPIDEDASQFANPNNIEQLKDKKKKSILSFN